VCSSDLSRLFFFLFFSVPPCSVGLAVSHVRSCCLVFPVLAFSFSSGGYRPRPVLCALVSVFVSVLFLPCQGYVVDTNQILPRDYLHNYKIVPRKYLDRYI